MIQKMDYDDRELILKCLKIYENVVDALQQIEGWIHKHN